MLSGLIRKVMGGSPKNEPISEAAIIQLAKVQFPYLQGMNIPRLGRLNEALTIMMNERDVSLDEYERVMKFKKKYLR